MITSITSIIREVGRYLNGGLLPGALQLINLISFIVSIRIITSREFVLLKGWGFIQYECILNYVYY